MTPQPSLANRPKEGGPFPRWVWIALAHVIVAAFAAYLFLHNRAVHQQRIADSKAWEVSGPACPTITKAAFLAPGQRGAQRFEFEGAAFYRRYGQVECAAIRDKGGLGETLHAVCRFSRPSDLMVKTAAGEWFFRPGAGHPATVSTATVTPSCVMGGGAAAGR